jgi:DNA-binding NtrC family response regulator
MARRIVLAEDSPSEREQLRLLLARNGTEVEAVEDGASALEAARTNRFQLLITDFRMPDIDGMQLLKRIRTEKLPLGVVLLTGYGDTDLALAAMKAGADDFVTKPYEHEHLLKLAERVIERRRLQVELEQLQNRLHSHYSFQNMVSKNTEMRKVFDMIERVGPLPSAVLISGETGTGKELVARAIHSASPRRDQPFVAVNCAALVDSLLESELFGHERGAFTGAEQRKLGRFEVAHGGTLLLDEIGEISPAMQAKLLRVLQTGAFERVGGERTIKSDVRLIAATNRRLDAEVRAGKFRADLYYRLNVVRIEVPSLRDRVEDVPLLAIHFLNQLGVTRTPALVEIDPQAMQALVDYQWPGNVRELENTLRGAFAFAHGPALTREALPPHIAARGEHRGSARPTIAIERPLTETADELISGVERDYLSRLLVKYKGNVARCARHCGLSRRSVTEKLRKHGLARDRFKSSSINSTI